MANLIDIFNYTYFTVAVILTIIIMIYEWNRGTLDK